MQIPTRADAIALSTIYIVNKQNTKRSREKGKAEIMADVQRIKRRIFSGVVCEQEVFSVSSKIKDIKTAEPRQRFKTDEEREQHKLGISKRKHARMVNENFSPRSLYSTLTMDDEHEVHTFKDAKRTRDLFIRRLRYKMPAAQISIYMGRGKNTHRIHFHMLSDGVPEALIREQWKAGNVLRIEPMREHNYYNGVDYGQDYTGLANYLFDHWTVEQGGHRWKQTNNLRKPDKETPTIIKRVYTEKNPPRPPKGYKFVESRSTKFGYLYFKYVVETEKRRSQRKE